MRAVSLAALGFVCGLRVGKPRPRCADDPQSRSLRAGARTGVAIRFCGASDAVYLMCSSFAIFSPFGISFMSSSVTDRVTTTITT